MSRENIYKKKSFLTIFKKSHYHCSCSRGALSKQTCSQRGGGFTQAGVPQRFGRAINFQIHTKLSAGIHPRLRETARCRQFFYFLVKFCCHIVIIYHVFNCPTSNVH